MGLATAANFPDSLAGGVHMSLQGGPLLLTNPVSLSPAASAFLEANKAITIGFVYGGAVAVSDATLSAAVAAIT